VVHHEVLVGPVDTMGEQVFFGEVVRFKAKADALFASVDARLRALLPCAFVEHVGSTSLPDGLTKGDLDVQVRVPPESFEVACRTLASLYEENPGGFTDGGHSYKDDSTDPPLGVHVTVIDGPSDIQFRQRDILRARADLRAEYDALKRSFHGARMDEYREAKHAFWSELGLKVKRI
jgi:GrpB-like predicted nucleotidyltransferase (UPF0157 family)